MSSRLIGRSIEKEQIKKAIGLHRNILIEGPVGVGKTFLVQQILEALGKDYERVDGDSRYTEQKLTGWFDPPVVLKKGYLASAFIDGPLVTAMKKGCVLFINELNRMPEAVQNILLPAMDERRIVLPKIGEIRAKEGFLVIATQNPREFTATHSLSEALLDRFEMIHLDYQTREDELQMLRENGNSKLPNVERIVDLVRATRTHPSVKRGASIRAGLAIADLLRGGMDLEAACVMALPTRIELVSLEEDSKDFVLKLLAGVSDIAQKKKSLSR